MAHISYLFFYFNMKPLAVSVGVNTVRVRFKPFRALLGTPFHAIDRKCPIFLECTFRVD